MEQLLPWLLGIFATLLAAFGVIGRFTLDFIKSERTNSSEITKAFIDQLKQQGAECTQERLRQADLLESMQTKMFESMNSVAKAIGDHTEKSIETYRQGSLIATNQDKILLKLEELIEAINQDTTERRERRQKT